MANLFSVAELAWRQLNPNPGDETAISKEEFIETAKLEFAYQTLLMSWKERELFGFWEVPSYLTTEVEKEIVDNEMDISDIKVFRSLPQEIWIRNIGGINCDCKYVKSTINHAALLCDDDSLPDSARTFYVVGKKIKFPDGVHKNPLTLIYANMGFGLDGWIEVEDAIAGIVRSRLIEIYGGKTAPEDETNNSNSQN